MLIQHKEGVRAWSGFTQFGRLYWWNLVTIVMHLLLLKEEGIF
jgi:hypothetical protein